MFLGKNKKNNENNEKKKIDKKDLAIVVISAVALVLLIFIIILSNQRNQMISDTLQKDKSASSDDIIAKASGNIDRYLELTEVSADKWLEVHNKGTEAMDLSGIEVYVAGNKAATIEDNTLIKKDEYYSIDLSVNPGAYDSNVITIQDKEGNALLSVIIPKLESGKSYGLADSENNLWGYMKSSKSKANSASEIEYVQYDGIALSAPGGFYDSSFKLEIGSKDGETIYYTTDGTAPNLDSDKYSEPITINNKSGSNYVYAKEASYNRLHLGYMPGTVDTGMIVRAISVNTAGEITGEVSQAYYIGLKNDSNYLNLPVLSITTDPENLFDYESGIYVSGKYGEDALIQNSQGGGHGNYYNNWKKPSIIEYYEPNKGKSFECSADMSIIVDNNTHTLQKDMAFEITDDNYTMYEGSSILDYISSQGMIRILQNSDDNLLKVREYISNTLASETGIGTQDFQPCAVFLDGEFWGVYSMKTSYDEKYIERKYGVTGQDIIFHDPQQYNAEFLNFYSYVTTTDLSVQENYEVVSEMMDIDNFIDYICFNIYLGKSNFSPYRGIAWKTATSDSEGYADGKWRFLCGEMHKTMYLSEYETSSINSLLQPGVQGDLVLQSLLMNDEFCEKFESHMNKMISEVFDVEKCNAVVDETSALMMKPAINSYTRYFGNYTQSEYQSGISNIKAFFEERPEYIEKYTKEFAAAGGDLAKAREIIDKENSQNNSEPDDAIEGNEEAEDIEEGGLEDIEGAENTGENDSQDDSVNVTEDNTNG